MYFTYKARAGTAKGRSLSKVDAIRKETEKRLNLAVCEIATAKRMSDDAASNAHDKIIAERGFHLAKAKTTAVTTHKQHTKELLL